MNWVLVVRVLLGVLVAVAAAVPSMAAPEFSHLGLSYGDIRRAFQEAKPKPAPIRLSQPMHAWPWDKVQPPGMPAVGKWMLDADGRVAHWLNWPYGRWRLNEPINVILRVKAETMYEANVKLLKAVKSAGFLIRIGHSGGYQAYLGTGVRYPLPQIPAVFGGAFADEVATSPNNHGRLFGPIRFRGVYYFIGAFSQEGAPLHSFQSFKKARDRFAEQMRKLAGARYRPEQSVNLGNAIPADPLQTETTADHDGFAALIDLP